MYFYRPKYYAVVYHIDKYEVCHNNLVVSKRPSSTLPILGLEGEDKVMMARKGWLAHGQDCQGERRAVGRRGPEPVARCLSLVYPSITPTVK